MASIPESSLVGVFEMLTDRLGRLESRVDSLAATAESGLLATRLAAQRGQLVYSTGPGTTGVFGRTTAARAAVTNAPIVGGRTYDGIITVCAHKTPDDGPGLVAFGPSVSACVEFPVEALEHLCEASGFGDLDLDSDASAACAAKLAGVRARARALLPLRGVERFSLVWLGSRSGEERAGLEMESRACEEGGLPKFWDEWVELAYEVLGEAVAPPPGNGCWWLEVWQDPARDPATPACELARCDCNIVICECE